MRGAASRDRPSTSAEASLKSPSASFGTLAALELAAASARSFGRGEVGCRARVALVKRRRGAADRDAARGEGLVSGGRGADAARGRAGRGAGARPSHRRSVREWPNLVLPSARVVYARRRAAMVAVRAACRLCRNSMPARWRARTRLAHLECAARALKRGGGEGGRERMSAGRGGRKAIRGTDGARGA